MPAWLQPLNRWPKPLAAAASLAAVVAIGLFDYETGMDVSVTLLYLGPVAFAAWWGGTLARGSDRAS